MREFTLIIVALLVSSSALAEASIYRCIDEEGTVIFSDRPCDEEARAYEGAATLSVINAPEDVEARAEANRAFIEARRERQSEARRQGLQQEQQPPASVRPVRPQTQFVPFWAPYLEEQVPPTGNAREREESFSALSGRQPASTRRRD